nr:SLC13 family permease [Thiomonas sp. X19]
MVLLQEGRASLACGLVLAVFVLTDRDVLKQVDWLLLATFAAMFLGLGHLAQWPPVQALVQTLDWKQAWVMFLGGTLLSQFISNVPTAVLLSHYTTDYTALAVAVNVGGFGLGIGSLANLIALRLEGSRGALGAFHRISVPFLLVCAPLVWLAQRVLA